MRNRPVWATALIWGAVVCVGVAAGAGVMFSPRVSVEPIFEILRSRTAVHIAAMPFPKLSYPPPKDPIRAAYREAMEAPGPGYPLETYVEHMRIPWEHLPRCQAIVEKLLSESNPCPD